MRSVLPRTPAESDYVTADHVSRLINQLAGEFKYVIVDTAPGLGEHVLATLEQATDGVWVCGMDVPSVRGLRKCFSVLKDCNCYRKAGIPSSISRTVRADCRCRMSRPQSGSR